VASKAHRLIQQRGVMYIFSYVFVTSCEVVQYVLLCLLLALTPPTNIQTLPQDAALLVSWEAPACQETGYFHAYLVEYCHSATDGGFYLLNFTLFCKYLFWCYFFSCGKYLNVVSSSQSQFPFIYLYDMTVIHPLKINCSNLAANCLDILVTKELYVW